MVCKNSLLSCKINIHNSEYQLFKINLFVIILIALVIENTILKNNKFILLVFMKMKTSPRRTSCPIRS